MEETSSAGVPFGGMRLFSSSSSASSGPRPTNQFTFAQGHAFRTVHRSRNDDVSQGQRLQEVSMTTESTQNYDNSVDQVYHPSQYSNNGQVYDSYEHNEANKDHTCLNASYEEAAICLDTSYEEAEDNQVNFSANEIADCHNEEQRLSEEYYHFLSGILADNNLSENDNGIDDDESFTFSETALESDFDEDSSPKRVTLKECRDLQSHQQLLNSSNLISEPQTMVSRFVALEHHQIAIRRQFTELFQTLLQVNIIASHHRVRCQEVFDLTSLMMRRLLEERTRARLELPLPPDTSTLPGRQTSIITRSAWHSALPGEISDRPPLIDIPALAIWAKHSAPINSLREAFVVLGPDNIDRSLAPPFSETQLPIISKESKFTSAEDDLLRLGLQKFGYSRAVSAVRNILSPLSPDWERICSRYVPGRSIHQARARYKSLFRKGDFVKGTFNANSDLKNDAFHLTEEEFGLVQQGIKLYGNQWSRIVKEFLPHRDRKMVRREYLRFLKAGGNQQSDENTDPSNVESSPVRVNRTFSDTDNRLASDDVTRLIRSALDLSPIATVDSDARSPLSELHALPLHGLSLPNEPSWVSRFDSPASIGGSPQIPGVDVTFDKSADREILLAAKHHGSDVKLWPMDSLTLFRRPGYTRSVIKTRLKQLTLILAQRKNLNTCI